MKLQIGDRVRIKNYSQKDNGRTAVVIDIDGGYIMVQLDHNPEIQIELYDCEMDRI